MCKTRNILMALFTGFLLVAAILYICGEFMQIDMTVFDNPSRQQLFIWTTLFILLTIALLPLSLRLFKFKCVSRDLQQRKAAALARWGSLRLCTLGLLLVANTFLYYAFGFEPTFGYLAVVTLLCMPFVVPTMSRCNTEIEPTVSDGSPVGTPDSQPTVSDGSPVGTPSNDEEANGSNSQL